MIDSLCIFKTVYTEPEILGWLQIKSKQGRMCIMGLFDGKKVIIIGDRDGIPGPAVEECLKSTQAEIVFSSTECFV